MSIPELFLDLLYPRKCAFCHTLTENGEKVCPGCIKNIHYTDLASRRQTIGNNVSCVSPLFYDGDVKKSLRRYKFSGISSYAEVYAPFVVKCIDENCIDYNIITWVPLSRKRYRSRGYDQAKLIALEISALTGKECVGLLKKTKHNPAQSGAVSAEVRRSNVSGVYETINEKAIIGKKILIIDDIVTTGATLSECARMLKAAGAECVSAATVARGHG